MEIIPYPFHVGALCGIVALAAYMRNLFPFVLVVMYAAFFYLVNLSFQYDISLFSQLILSSTLAAILFEVALQSKRTRYIKRFCSLMILSILNNILMYSLSPIDSGGYYLAAQYSTAFTSFSLSVMEFYYLTRIIYGTRRGEPIIATLSEYIMAVLSNFQYDCEALPASVWKEGTQDIRRQTEQR